MASIHAEYAATGVGIIEGNITNIIPFGAPTQIHTAAVCTRCIFGNAAEPGRTTVFCIHLRARCHIHTTAIDCGVLCNCAVDVTCAACRIHTAAVYSCRILGDCTVNITFACGYRYTAAMPVGSISGGIIGDRTVNITSTSIYMYAGAGIGGSVLADDCVVLNGAGTARYIDTARFGSVIVDGVPADGTITAKHADRAAVINTVAGNLGVAADVATAFFHHHSAGGFSGQGSIRDIYGTAGDVAGAPIYHGGTRDGTAGDIAGAAIYHGGTRDGTAGDIAGAARYIHRRSPFGEVFDFGGTTNVASATTPCRDGAVDRGSI